MSEKNPVKIEIVATCTGCGRCVSACTHHALTLATELPDGFGRKRAIVDPRQCTICGDCIPSCPHNALHLT